MQRIEGSLVLSASDLRRFRACPHVVELDRRVALGELERPRREDELGTLLAGHGRAHERSYLEYLIQQREQVTVVGSQEGWTSEARDAATSETVDAMVRGDKTIFQGLLMRDNWVGRVDFLIRVDEPSSLGAWSYETLDTKLHKDPAADDWLQLALYSWLLEPLIGRSPASMHVIGRDFGHHTVPVAEHRDEVLQLCREVDDFVRSTPAVEPEPNRLCDRCEWHTRCAERWVEVDHLSLAHVDARARPKFAAAGLTTVAALAGADQDLEVPGVTRSTFLRHRSNARLLMQERAAGEPHLRLRYPRPGQGLDALPASARGDLYFDMEGYQFAADGPIEYLFGLYGPDTDSFVALWAHTPKEERIAFEQAVDAMVAAREERPDMHVYHYNSYEPAALRRLTRRHETRAQEVEALCAGVLVDLLPIARLAVTTSTLSWSLKALERFYRPGRSGDVTEAAGSMVTYDTWLASRDRALLDGIESYNRTDCESLAELKEWLDGFANDTHEARTADDEIRADPLWEVADPAERIRLAVEAVVAGGPRSTIARHVVRRSLVAAEFVHAALPEDLHRALIEAGLPPETELLTGKKELGIPIPARLLQRREAPLRDHN